MVSKNLESFLVEIDKIQHKNSIKQKQFVTKEGLEDLLKEKAANLVNNNFYGNTIMGDQFKDISDSTIVNRSLIQSTMKSIEGNYGNDLSNTLNEISKAIEENGDIGVGKVYEAFVGEAGKEAPNKTLLKSLWTGIEAAVPTLKTTAEIGATVAKLF